MSRLLPCLVYFIRAKKIMAGSIRTGNMRAGKMRAILRTGQTYWLANGQTSVHVRLKYHFSCKSIKKTDFTT